MQNRNSLKRMKLVPKKQADPSTSRSAAPHGIQPSTQHSPRAKSMARPNTARAVVSGASIAPTAIKGPISPEAALTQYSPLLILFEKHEILSFPEIYYLGKMTKKANPKATAAADFDTASHHYKVQVGDHIAYRFEIRSLLGKGAFGQVLRCYDHKTQKQVAIKIIINTPQMAKQGQRELEILSNLVTLPTVNNYIIQLLDSFTFRDHVCAVFEVLGQNLYDYSKSMRFRPMAMPQVQTIAREILIALEFCHSHNIVHCDLKPENIMFNTGNQKDIQLIDFGSSCFIGETHFDYIQSRYYRAPEVILGIQYGPPMDIWSFACIVVELLTGKPLFPGANEGDQIAKHVELIGLPTRELVVSGKMSYKYFNESGLLRTLRGKKRVAPQSVTLSSLTSIKNVGLIDLLQKCLVFDQKKRITAREALGHPWFASNSGK